MPMLRQTRKKCGKNKKTTTQMIHNPSLTFFDTCEQRKYFKLISSVVKLILTHKSKLEVKI